MTYLMIQFK